MMVRDVVCGMELDPEDAPVVSLIHEGITYYFCSDACQHEFEVFAYGERDFFYKVVDAQLTFGLGADGRATGVILHQNGRDVPGTRVP